MWIQLTQAHVETSLNEIERPVYDQHATSTTLPARLPSIISQVTQQVRTDIASCDRNKMSIATDTIPEGYIYYAVAIARYRLLTALPHCRVSSDRKDEYDEALNYFRDVACCKRRPEPPQDPRDNEAPTLEAKKDIKVVRCRRQITGRDNLRGL